MKYSNYIKDGMLAWTLTSNGYKYLTWNFVLHWRRCVRDLPICVICADKASYMFFQRESIPCILIDQTLADYGPEICPFGSRNFSNLNRLKLKLLHMFAMDSAIQKCLYIDGDICIYKDIVADIRERLDNGGLWFQCDEKDVECSADEMAKCPNVCTGLIAWRHGSDGGIFHLDNEAIWSEKPEDQVWVNKKLARTDLSFSVLPRELYPNGVRVIKTKTDSVLQERAICLHYNWRVGGSKKADMKRFGDWLLPY